MCLLAFYCFIHGVVISLVRMVAFTGRTVCIFLHGPNLDAFIACILSHGRLCWLYCVSFSCPLCFFVSFFPLFRTVAFIGRTVCIFLHGPSLDLFYCLRLAAWSPLLVVLCVLFVFFLYLSRLLSIFFTL